MTAFNIKHYSQSIDTYAYMLIHLKFSGELVGGDHFFSFPELYILSNKNAKSAVLYSYKNE